jgi:hypothetical protein
MSDNLRRFNARFWFGDVVYLRMDKAHEPGIVTRINLEADDRMQPRVEYGIVWGSAACSYHQEYLLTDSPHFNLEHEEP